MATFTPIVNMKIAFSDKEAVMLEMLSGIVDVMVSTYNENRAYELDTADRNVVYEAGKLFNDILVKWDEIDV